MAVSHQLRTLWVTSLTVRQVVAGLAIISCSVLFSSSSAWCRETEFLGLNLGMSLEEVREVFFKAAIPLSDESSDVLSAPRPPAPADGAKLIRLFFEKGKLNKLSIRFKLPPHEPDATNLIAFFEKSKARINKELGHPAYDVVQMKATTPQERYDWLKRGLAYYQTIWKIGNEAKVILWLYGEDAEVVLMETYESLDNQ
ncbi:MAG: hypothetical protein HY914_20310 [Desulfomonile tiedjei]|nr:hypothetical protein [Desulfomonile tiedjei]